MSLPVAECFDMPETEDYPFMIGDLVCDSEYPDMIAWACVDEKWCATLIPRLGDLLRVENTWELIMDGVDAELSRTTVVPEVEATVDCATWANKFGDEDIGEEDYWCDADRVFECIEEDTCVTVGDVETCTRPLCSATTPSEDTRGVWVLLRGDGNEEAFDFESFEALEEEYFGTGVNFDGTELYCISDVTFSKVGPWLPGDNCEADGDYQNCLNDGVPCTSNPDLARRAFNSQVIPTGQLPEDPEDWPRNVYIADQSLPGEALETILAGVGYNDDVDREGLATIWQWFPALCAEKPEDSTMTYMELCKWEFVAITLMALTGEMTEDEFIYLREDALGDFDWVNESIETYYALEDELTQIAELDWYQTAFMTTADPGCIVSNGV